MNLDPQYVVFGVGSLAVVSASWGAARAERLVARADTKDLKKDLASHKEDDKQHQLVVVDRLARIETKLNTVLGIKE